MPGRGMHETRASVIGDVVAIEKRHDKIVTFAAKRVVAQCHRQRAFTEASSHSFRKPRLSRLLENVIRKLIGELKLIPLCPIIWRSIGDS